MKLTRLSSNFAIVAVASGVALKGFSRLWDEICGAIEDAVASDGSTGPFTAATYAVADLPAVGVGQVAYASNGRKNGEGAGSGTGVLVFSDATAWRACDTGATVAA
jgi:hypothetical protein